MNHLYSKIVWFILCHHVHLQGGPRKVKPTTILLVTFECVGEIQWFLADVNRIQQEVVWCKFYANFVIIITWHARWRHIRSTRHWYHWANGGKQPQNSPLPLEACRRPFNTWMSGVTDPTHGLKRQLHRCTHFCTTMQQSHTAWNTIHTCGVRMSPWSSQTCGHPTRWIIPFGWSCTSSCMQFTSAKNHWILPTHSNVTSKIVVGFTLRGPPCICGKEIYSYC